MRRPSYGILDFEARESIWAGIRERSEAEGIHLIEYAWAWDEEDCCLLLAGRYEKKGDARWWIRSPEAIGSEVCIQTTLP